MGAGLTGPGPTVGAAGHQARRGGQDAWQGQTDRQEGHTPAHTQHIHGHTRRARLNAPAHSDPTGDPVPSPVCHRRTPARPSPSPSPPEAAFWGSTVPDLRTHGRALSAGGWRCWAGPWWLRAVIRLGRLPAAMPSGSARRGATLRLMTERGKRLHPPRPAGRPARPGTAPGARRCRTLRGLPGSLPVLFHSRAGTLRCHCVSSLPVAGQGMLPVAGGRARS